MSEHEQEQLLTAVQTLAALQPGSAALITKLGALFQKHPRDWLRVDFHRWGPVNGNDERFEIIKTAVQEKRVLQFSYAGYDGFTQRRAKPILLYFKGDAWYLQAFCLMRGDFRTFKINRISGLVLTDEFFADTLEPPSIDPWEWDFQWPEVRLRFQPQMAYRVYDDFDEECIRRDTDGSLIVTTHMPPDDEWSAGRLLSYGTGVEVLSPGSLRKTAASCALRLYQHYEEGD